MMRLLAMSKAESQNAWRSEQRPYEKLVGTRKTKDKGETPRAAMHGATFG